MMKPISSRLQQYSIGLAIGLTLVACAGDPLQSGLDPFAPIVFKEGATAMPLNPPNQASLQRFYVSEQTVFKFAVDIDSIRIGPDGVTRYIVVMTSPSNSKQIQYEGIRCDSNQWKLYGTFDSGKWKENPLASWSNIKSNIPNRYQSSLASGAFCNINTQEKDLKTIIQSLNPNAFIGGAKPTNSFGVID